MSLTGVDLKEETLPECATLYIETFNSEPWNDQWDFDSALARLEDIYDTPGFFGLVLLDHGTIVAAVLGNLEHFYTGPIYNLKEMFVRQQLRGKRLGSSLLSDLNEQLKAKGVKSVWLFTTKGDMTEAFYVKNGYRGSSDMIMMARDL